MDRIVIVGSGASGVHFALSALQKGYPVLMVDVGRRKPADIKPEEHLNGLKTSLEDPAAYFLGSQYESLILPGYGAEYYGFPPSKSYVFADLEDFRYRATGFSPLVSFAAGGLAEAWTGGSYPFLKEDLSEFPFEYRDLSPYYEEVARRIGITGIHDDLARFFPFHENLLEPLDLDEHSAVLLASYEKEKHALNSKFRCYLGRSRSAVLTKDLGHRKACTQSGRCLWGCPSQALYVPSITLAECLSYPNFEYVPNLYASHFRFNSGGKVTSLVSRNINTGEIHHIPTGNLLLAAGTLASSAIFLRSLYYDSGDVIQLRGLMDNRQVLMPFVNLKMFGKPYNPQSYQYHQLAIALEGDTAREHVHGLVTTLKTALIHPVVQSLPFDLGTAVAFFRNMHAALGLVNINFADTRRPENFISLEPQGESMRLVVHYCPEEGEVKRIRLATRTFRTVLRKLGCLAPEAMTHMRPMGASVHYAGTIPMSRTPAPRTCTRECRSNDFNNLYFIDGTTFPSLPAKNLTFTLMANAARVAAEAF